MPDEGAPAGEERQARDASRHSGLSKAGRFIGETLGTFGFPFFWPYASMRAATELIFNSTDPVYRGHDIRYGDGKPVVLVPGHLAGEVTLGPLAIWLDAIGYRPAKPEVAINIDDRALDVPVAEALREAARRIGRKAVLIAFDTGVRAAMRVAADQREHVSDVIAVGLPDRLPKTPTAVRVHVIETSRKVAGAFREDMYIVDGSRALLPVNPAALKILSEILREIPISLLDPGHA
jgi:pimeloyl-ACP methyl ester carboxylesterase